MFAAGETITIRRRPKTGVDRDNNPVYGEPTEHDVDGVAVAPGSTADVNDVARAGVQADLTIYAPYGTDVVHGDQAVVRGDVYDVDGNPGDWRSPFSGWEAGTVFTLRRVEG